MFDDSGFGMDCEVKIWKLKKWLIKFAAHYDALENALVNKGLITSDDVEQELQAIENEEAHKNTIETLDKIIARLEYTDKTNIDDILAEWVKKGDHQ